MRLISFEYQGKLNFGVWLENRVLDLGLAWQWISSICLRRAVSRSHGNMLQFLEKGPLALNHAWASVEMAGLGRLPDKCFYPFDNVKLRAPIARPGKILCVDYNFQSYVDDVYPDVG